MTFLSVVFSFIRAFMVLKWNFVTVVLIILLNSASGKKKEFVVPYALNSIIEKHFATFDISPKKLDFLHFGSNNEMFTDLMDQLLRIKSEDALIRVFKFDLTGDIYQNLSFTIPNPSIVFFDSVGSFKANAFKTWWVSNERHRSHHLVYVPGLTFLDIVETLDDGFLIDHVNFLMHETDNSIELVTSFMFTPQACEQLQLKIINRFDLQAMEWENSIFYPKKYENFYGCKLGVAVMEETGCDFVLYNFLKTIFEEHLNSKLFFYKSTNLFDYDLNCQKCVIAKTQEDNFIISDPIQFVQLHFIIAPGEPYTDFERMFMMFDFELWIAISVTFVIAFISTLMLNFVSTKIRNFIVGHYVQNPTLNLISTFLTGSQARTPGRNFARFILMLFIFWSLIIRTCHQSMLYKLMQEDLRRPTIETNDEFFESDLTFYSEHQDYIVNEQFWEQMAKPSTRFVN